MNKKFILSCIIMTCIVQNNLVMGMHGGAQAAGESKDTATELTAQVLRATRRIIPTVRNQSPQEIQRRLQAAHCAILRSDLKDLQTALKDIPHDIIVTARLCNIIPQKKSCNSLRCISRLLNYCDRDHKTRTLFHLAVIQRASKKTSAALEIVKHLLQYGFNLNTTDYPTGTAVHAAASKSDVDLLTLLLQPGYNANPNIPNRISMTPLIQNLRRNNRQVIQLLLDAGADPRLNWFILQQEDMTRDPEIRKMILARKAALQR